MSELKSADSSGVASSPSDSTAQWAGVADRFLGAVAPRQRKPVSQLLHNIHNGGSGPREWVSAVTWRGGVLQTDIPEEVIDVYLADSEAMPLHDCESCGLAVPVRPCRFFGPE